MSFLVSSRRRIYVLMLFRARLGDGESPLARHVRQVESAVSTDTPAGAHRRLPIGRVAMSAGVQQRLGRVVFGVRFFVIALESRERLS